MLVLVAVASALALSGSAYADRGPRTTDHGLVVAQSETVTADDFVDKNNDGFRDEDPSQPWPLYAVAGILIVAAIAATVKLFRG